MFYLSLKPFRAFIQLKITMRLRIRFKYKYLKLFVKKRKKNNYFTNAKKILYNELYKIFLIYIFKQRILFDFDVKTLTFANFFNTHIAD